MVVERKIVIKNKMGLHARPAAIFVQMANKFDCEISVKRGNQQVNGKSIMGILMLAAGRGSKILIKAEGLDAEAAVNELERFLSGELDDTLFRDIMPKTKKDVSSKGKLISAEETGDKDV
ncbi:MAG: HPr family phosphocarrier protein [Candidatus Omnitrophica bacterium]|nr:HPr family phosphocarrier protein [Candidatus Omnitrophota bacterium]